MKKEEAEGGAVMQKEAVRGKVHISVRKLVEFILRHGDIDQRYRASPENAMQEGGRIHRMIQRRMGADYQAEVPLQFVLALEEYDLVIEGRADGIIRQEGKITVDEIKGTYRDLARLREPLPLHLAQAKCYAYMAGANEGLEKIQVRMTYCNMISEEIKYFNEEYSFRELKEWFGKVVEAWQKWADYSWKWHGVRQASIMGLAFPFAYREGQKELAVNVYRTIYHKKKLFLEAPTGVGKTISTLYPAIQAMGKGMGEKIFYLTAKTITRTVAEDTLNLLREKGLRMKSVLLTAKEKICFMEETECNPEYCPYAKGHYDRINDAIYSMLTQKERYDRACIEEYADRYRVCPFELCLDMSLYADTVICDYNYLFDPHIYLKRFFADAREEDYIFLVDEAHNLLERGRAMYSAVLWKGSFLEVRSRLRKEFQQKKEQNKTSVSGNKKGAKNKEVSGQMTLNMTEEVACVSQKCSIEEKYDSVESDTVDQISTDGPNELEGQLIYQLGRCNQEMLLLKRECTGSGVLNQVDGLVQKLMRLQAVMDDFLFEQEHGSPARDILLDFYFEISHFLDMYELLDENYVKYARLLEDGDFMVKLFCVNPGKNLRDCMQRGRSSILFSATFLPIQYYKKLLGGADEDYEVYARPVFSPARRGLYIAKDVTSKYTRRSEEEYANIARYIEEIVKIRQGNYMVFCPSYAFLQTIYEKYVEAFGGEGRQCVLQKESMGEADREEFLDSFKTDRGDRRESLVGFCVLGGIFGEGIDLKHDSLIGAIVVGTGLPQVCEERELLKKYFDEAGEDGFDYAYRYPGLNKVLQAAGRVIRTMEDVGVVVLLDERFLQYSYRRLFPREWEKFETVTVNSIAEKVEEFWKQWTQEGTPWLKKDGV